MTHSASSASSLDSHALSESCCQSQGVRWEEQQKVLALEQLCGVFRVDLGHMRSLRLFFRSDIGVKGHHRVTRGSLLTSLLYFVCKVSSSPTQGYLTSHFLYLVYLFIYFHLKLDNNLNSVQSYRLLQEGILINFI